MLSESSAHELLKTLKASTEVIEHSEAVHETCMNLVDLLREAHPHFRINKRLVAVGSLLHDVGRTKTQGLDHGIVGAEIIRGLNVKDDPDMEKIAMMCERHLGGGIGKEEAAKLGLPKKDYLPKSIEEKIIAYCDNMIDDTRSGPVVHDPAWAALDYDKKHGKNSEPAKRVRELNRFFAKLLS